MNYNEFIGKVQNLGRIATTSEAVRATRATLKVLSKRLFGEEAANLAAQLPEEIATYLERDGADESFDLDTFYERVSQEEGEDLPVAVHHARSVIAVVKQAVTAGEIADIRAQLPEQYGDLFEAEIKGT